MRNIRKQLSRAYEALDNIFTDKEAWMLFRLAAFSETIGWMLLITGILFSHYEWAWHETVLAIGGSIHGIIFVFYTFIIIFAHRSLGWGVWRFIVSGIVSNFPFGALIFEMWESHRRKLTSKTV